VDRPRPSDDDLDHVGVHGIAAARGRGRPERRRGDDHWGALDELARLGAIPVRERVVKRGKIITGAGVSAGIDMALTLAASVAGEEYARTLPAHDRVRPGAALRRGLTRQGRPETMQRAFAVMMETMQQLAARTAH
jgi:transcriptional regulator GlxA family with amidase domain